MNTCIEFPNISSAGNEERNSVPLLSVPISPVGGIWVTMCSILGEGISLTCLAVMRPAAYGSAEQLSTYELLPPLISY